MIYQLVPNIGFLPVTLGMTYDQLVSVAGPPSSRDTVYGEENIWFKDNDLRVTMQDGAVVEASVSPPSDVLFEGKSLFKSRGHWKALVTRDDGPLESVGFVILKSLGVAFTGLHDRVRSQFAVTIFQAGRFDELGDATPFLV